MNLEREVGRTMRDLPYAGEIRGGGPVPRDARSRDWGPGAERMRELRVAVIIVDFPVFQCHAVRKRARRLLIFLACS